MVLARVASVLAVVTVAVAAMQPAAASGTPLPPPPLAAPVRPPGLAPGNVPVGSTALGSVPAGQELGLNVVLPPSHNAQLQILLRGLYDPGSPDYHQWLQPGQFTQRFGPTAAAVDAVRSWLRGVGLTVTGVSGFAVQVQATAAQITAALGTPFERYRTRSGHLGYLAQRTPLVPTSLAGGQIAAVLGLDTVATFQPEGAAAPLSRTRALPAVQNPDVGPTACSAAQAAAGGAYYTLNTLGSAYGVGSLLANGQTGQGETVGLYELASNSTSDVATYASCFGLTSSVSTVPVDGGGGAVGGNGTTEADVDIEQVATQAPGASLISYEGPNTQTGAYDVWNQIVSADKVQVVSTSWGICEPYAAAEGEVASYATLFAQAASQGQSVLAASGDSGSEGCAATDGTTNLDVDYPASDTWVTGVGGTDLFGAGDEVAWEYGGGGISRYVADPSWQPVDLHWSGTGNSCGIDCREVPDISANAGVGMEVYSGGAWSAVGGTSLAAPLVAGIVADRNNGCTTPTADLAPTLYAAASQGLYGTGLTDITSGNNDATGSYGGEFFAASSGYDPVTGLGSPLAAGLSCPEVTSVGPGYAGNQVTVSGLGLEHATVTFGSTSATVVSATSTSSTVVVPAGTGTVTVRATSSLGTGTQTATFTYGTPLPVDPPGGATPLYPSFDNGSVRGVRDTGSETTLGVTQTIGDLYTAAGLFGCTLNAGTEPSLYNATVTSAKSNAEGYCQKNGNVATTDTVDNWDRTEVGSGVDDAGSTPGQSQLCGTLNSPLPVDFARSSEPPGTACPNLKGVGFAKDSVPAVDFPVDPAAFGTAAASSPYASVDSGRIGDVPGGWLPGDPTGGPYSGTPLTNLANNDNGGGSGSTAYRLWCTSGPTRITDWGQLTNLGPALSVPAVTLTAGSKVASVNGTVSTSIVPGQSVTDLTRPADLGTGTSVASVVGNSITLSAPAVGSATDDLSVGIGTTLAVGSGGAIGLPVRLVGVNSNSGTEAAWAGFAESGVTSGGCSSNANANAASDPNEATAGGGNAGPHLALENNASLVGVMAAADFPGDTASQAIEVTTSLYYESNGAYASNPYTGSVTIAGSRSSGSKVTLNGVSPTAANVLSDKYPTSRTLFDIYRSDTVRASTAGFLNWECDSQTAIDKEADRATGVSLDAELTNAIGSFGFIRLTDASEVASAGNTPADGVVGGGINTSCASGLNSGGTAGDGQPPVTTVASPQT